MRSVGSRIEILERATGAGVCPGCGRDAQGEYPDPGAVEFELYTDGRPVEPGRCPECGRPGVVVTLDIGDLGHGRGDA
jgi:hypothetical protein